MATQHVLEGSIAGFASEGAREFVSSVTDITASLTASLTALLTASKGVLDRMFAADNSSSVSSSTSCLGVEDV